MSEAWKNALSGLSQLKSGSGSTSRTQVSPEVQPSILVPKETDWTWTPSQEKVLTCRSPRIQVVALAGSGKTQVMNEFARRRSRARWLYLTYNSELARRARELFPAHVQVKTFHGLAFSRFGAPLAHRFDRLWKPGDLNQILKQNWSRDVEARWRETLLQTLDRFMASSCPCLEVGHIDQDHWYLARKAGDPIPHDVATVLAQAEQLWAAILDPGAPWPVTHDVYLKSWCLAEVDYASEGILVDEDQDLSPAMHVWLTQQSGLQVRAGDPYQGIYGFRGASGQHELVAAERLGLPESFRFGQAIAEEANAVLARLGEDRLIGRGPDDGQVHASWQSHPRTMLLARTRAGLLDAALEAVDRGVRVSQTIRSTDQIDSALALWEGRCADIRDPWVAGFSTFDAWEEALQQSSGGLTVWRSVCGLVRKRGSRLRQELQRLNDARDPNGWLLSTIHGVKGQTYDHVALADDLMWLNPQTPEGREEAQVAYVAMTRARHSLAHSEAGYAKWKAWQAMGQQKPVAPVDDGF